MVFKQRRCGRSSCHSQWCKSRSTINSRHKIGHQCNQHRMVNRHRSGRAEKQTYSLLHVSSLIFRSYTEVLKAFLCVVKALSRVKSTNDSRKLARVASSADAASRGMKKIYQSLTRSWFEATSQRPSLCMRSLRVTVFCFLHSVTLETL